MTMNFIIVVILVILVNANDTIALKGSKRDGSLRLLQNALPIAGEPKDSSTAPKEGAVSPDNSMPKDAKDSKDTKESKDKKEKEKKGKKCKKAKKTPPPAVTNDGTTTASSSVQPEGRLLPEEPMEGSNDEEGDFCLQGAVTEAECQAAMAGKVPSGDRIIQADVAMDISYNMSQTSKDVLNEVGLVLQSQTAAEFIGCDNVVGNRYLQQTTTTDGNETTYEEIRVTGVDFKKLKTMGPGDCTSTNDVCDSISSTVQIHYQGEPITSDDQQEMFHLLLATITTQSMDGDFSHVGTIENVERTSDITNATGYGSATDIAKKAGIPAGVVGAILIIAGGLIIGYCCMGNDDDDDDDDDDNDGNKNKNKNSRNTTTNAGNNSDVVHAEAIAIIDDEEDDKKKSKFSWNPSKFL